MLWFFKKIASLGIFLPEVVVNSSFYQKLFPSWALGPINKNLQRRFLLNQDAIKGHLTNLFGHFQH